MLEENLLAFAKLKLIGHSVELTAQINKSDGGPPPA